MKLASCLSWVAQGVPSALPQKVRLPKNELELLLHGAPAETSDNDEEGDEGEEAESGGSLRGSEKDLSDDEQQSTEQRYDMEGYDKEQQQGDSNPLAGLACFANQQHDPYIEGGGDEEEDDDDDDKDDFQLRPDDNLLLVGRVDKEQFNMEVWVYNSGANDFYVHHDYLLESPPLCFTSINYDPGSEEAGGNLCALGTMESELGIWDLDLVDALAPVIVLGGQEKTAKKAKKQKREGHSDAVICVAWNSNTQHVLASGSADQTVALWDLDTAKLSCKLERHGEKVTCLSWHPVESSLLLSCGADSRVFLWDCRAQDVQSKWKLGAEVEKVLWDPFNPFCLVAATDTGSLSYMDSRNSKTKLFTQEDMHEDLNDLTLNSKVKGCLVTAGGEELKIWKIGNEAFESCGVLEPKVGKVHAALFCVDAERTIAVAGDGGDYVRLCHLESVEQFR